MSMPISACPWLKEVVAHKIAERQPAARQARKQGPPLSMPVIWLAEKIVAGN
jgi:hypothetical protein